MPRKEVSPKTAIRLAILLMAAIFGMIVLAVAIMLVKGDRLLREREPERFGESPRRL